MIRVYVQQSRTKFQALSYSTVELQLPFQEEIEEEDGDYIERVLWHQPKGTAEDAISKNESTEPVLLSRLFDSMPDWNDMEFLIKWKGLSHLHCQWKSFSELQNVCFIFRLLSIVVFNSYTVGQKI